VGFRLLDVFTDVPFAGNQLCVVPDPPPELTDEQMMILTREIAFSETTFVTAVREAGYDVRIFTPNAEIPFAGHPTLGTAFALVDVGRVAPDLVQRCGAGEVSVSVDRAAGRASMRQLPVAFGDPVEDRAPVAAAAGLAPSDLVPHLPIVRAGTGLDHLMVPVRDEASLRRARRHGEACLAVTAATNTESLYLFVVRGAGDVMARMFDQADSIGEDPATGSAAGPLGAYLSEHGLAGMPGSVTVTQGELVGRPSSLHVTVQGHVGAWDVQVSGGVWPVGEGAFEL
jgi:trans-2,3-dihydro-3-hydroxyanthranilate isomerase